MSYTRICVAVALQRYLDLPPVALRQRDLARAVARLDGASILVLSVNAPVEYLPGVETTDEKLARFAQPLLDEGLEVRAELREGRPSVEIEASVREAGADLVIIGSHSKRGPLDVGLGSTAAALRRDLEVPVIMIRPTPSEIERARELMIPKYPIIFPYG